MDDLIQYILKGELQMRKIMSKEVTFTTIKTVKIEVVEGQPTNVLLPDEIMIGSITFEKALKAMKQKYGESIIVYDMITETKVYEMEVEDFIKHASLKTDK
jgi:hypothetical protein